MAAVPNAVAYNAGGTELYLDQVMGQLKAGVVPQRASDRTEPVMGLPANGQHSPKKDVGGQKDTALEAAPDRLHDEIIEGVVRDNVQSNKIDCVLDNHRAAASTGRKPESCLGGEALEDLDAERETLGLAAPAASRLAAQPPEAQAGMMGFLVRPTALESRREIREARLAYGDELRRQAQENLLRRRRAGGVTEKPGALQGPLHAPVPPALPPSQDDVASDVTHSKALIGCGGPSPAELRQQRLDAQKAYSEDLRSQIDMKRRRRHVEPVQIPAAEFQEGAKKLVGVQGGARPFSQAKEPRARSVGGTELPTNDALAKLAYGEELRQQAFADKQRRLEKAVTDDPQHRSRKTGGSGSVIAIQNVVPPPRPGAVDSTVEQRAAYGRELLLQIEDDRQRRLLSSLTAAPQRVRPGPGGGLPLIAKNGGVTDAPSARLQRQAAPLLAAGTAAVQGAAPAGVRALPPVPAALVH